MKHVGTYILVVVLCIACYMAGILTEQTVSNKIFTQKKTMFIKLDTFYIPSDSAIKDTDVQPIIH